jgi:hypothetical protein
MLGELAPAENEPAGGLRFVMPIKLRWAGRESYF